jgi:hypothetical protein
LRYRSHVAVALEPRPVDLTAFRGFSAAPNVILLSQAASASVQPTWTVTTRGPAVDGVEHSGWMQERVSVNALDAGRENQNAQLRCCVRWVAWRFDYEQRQSH